MAHLRGKTLIPFHNFAIRPPSTSRGEVSLLLKMSRSSSPSPNSVQRTNPRPIFRVHLCDLNDKIVEAWKQHIGQLSLSYVEVTYECADIVNVVTAHDKMIDCIVSPANSFGLMDGGIDLAICKLYGGMIQKRFMFVITESSLLNHNLSVIDGDGPGRLKCDDSVCATASYEGMELLPTSWHMHFAGS